MPTYALGATGTKGEQGMGKEEPQLITTLQSSGRKERHIQGMAALSALYGFPLLSPKIAQLLSRSPHPKQQAGKVGLTYRVFKSTANVSLNRIFPINIINTAVE